MHYLKQAMETISVIREVVKTIYDTTTYDELCSSKNECGISDDTISIYC